MRVTIQIHTHTRVFGRILINNRYGTDPTRKKKTATRHVFKTETVFEIWTDK